MTDDILPYEAPAPHASPNLPRASEPPLTTIGDITITRSQVITPAASFPLRGSAWSFSDMSHVVESTPPVAIVLAILFFLFCLLGLLFLLMKERKTVGYVQVTVNGSGHHYATMIPVWSPKQIYTIAQQVRWAQWMAGHP
jgi:hypothetical protein